MAEGLSELWKRHLSETLPRDGQTGFSRFNLWMKREGKSVQIKGEPEGLIRLRDWMLDRRIGSARGCMEAWDMNLLSRVAAAHARLILEGRSCEAIAALAVDCQSSVEFERRLFSLTEDAL